VVARLGRLLGIAFGICFLTGLISHNAQSPSGVLLSPWPAWGYRVTQGIHVATGIACLPLLIAKIFSAYPLILARPGAAEGRRARWRSLLSFTAERGLTAVLVGAGIAEVTTGLFNIFQWYAFRFAFVPVHFAVAWIAVGAIMIHIAVKLPVLRTVFRRRPDDHRQPNHQDARTAAPVGTTAWATTAADPGMSTDRRRFVSGTLAVAGGLSLLTVGQSVSGLGRLAVLAPRRPSAVNVQGVPINRTAIAAGVLDRIDRWRLTVAGPGSGRMLRLSDLEEMEQVTVALPIACVEGWSVDAEWTGVRVRDLVGLVGGAGHDVSVQSLERRSAYGSTVLPAAFADDPRTLLALRINGDRLDPDHGYPARIIAPNRPGVLQTKWVERLEVRS
jgi:DMSO/TMAO reductase YedYZ molybdopterin-dependent catalytic subunit